MTGLLDDSMTRETAYKKTGLVREAWELEVYKRAYSVSLAIHKITKQFPPEERFELASQMRKCSKSICANLVEGFAKQPFSDAEFKRFIAIAIGSAAEMQVWLQYSADLNYIDPQMAVSFRKDYSSISQMLMKLHVKI